MKKIIIYIAFICLIFAMTSCVVDETKKASNEKSIEIIRCFDEKDAEGLKALFCEEVRISHNLDEEIQLAFDLYEGTSETYKFNYAGGTAGGWDNGECIDEHITPRVENLKTSSGKVYRIPYHEYLIYKKNPRCVGITYIRIFDESTGEMVQIGEHVY